ncbi:hypothetical protein CXG81DRAFT_15023 [Caulochytrium protostelioides]|uniref:Large ribosomal subunit protein mL44 n=1 Tax=Caulochytrium protostelioides TaxID=1555241 RepID=A0A4P9WZR7_9FUNG|nr:hypothetical protein CXG81DRAFT_15023 [Caulochytrium protostelioides]|eukprot:RKO99089.1 hypothetical protein CXG81DRAFT_15023 [Caulochytrium protostelioides]
MRASAVTPFTPLVRRSATATAAAAAAAAAAARPCLVRAAPSRGVAFVAPVVERPIPLDAITTKVRAQPRPPTHAEQQAHLAALIERLGVRWADPTLLEAALTHASATTTAAPRLQVLGERALTYYVTEHVLQTYPKLPADAVRNVVEALAGPRALYDIAAQFGVPSTMRWQGAGQAARAAARRASGERAAAARVLQGIVGAVHVDQGAAAAQQFIATHVLSRHVDLEAHLALAFPKATLARLCAHNQLPRPIARLLKETGRHSHRPVFVVGMYAGTEQIGEGWGTSLAMAETRAAKDALRLYYTNPAVKTVAVTAADEEEAATTFVAEA